MVKVFCELFDLKNLSVATITTVLRNYLATYATERHIFLYHCAEKYDCIILNCETVMIASSLIIKLCSNKKLRDQNLDQSNLIIKITCHWTCWFTHACFILGWHISAITCQIIMSTCLIFTLTCQLFMLTCEIIMSTCQKNITTTTS